MLIVFFIIKDDWNLIKEKKEQLQITDPVLMPSFMSSGLKLAVAKFKLARYLSII